MAAKAKRPREVASKAHPVPQAPAASNAEAVRRVIDEQKILVLSKEGPLNADTKDFCGAFAALDIDNSWDLAFFKKGFSIQITHMDEELVTFDMIGIDPPLANAFRRILLAEVPTVAISRVTVFQNTGVVHDENLAHRLGLVPIVFEPELLQWRDADGDFNEDNSVVFSLRKECPQGRNQRVSVYSGDLVWEPLSPAQEQRFKDKPPRPVRDDILLAKLRAGQEIECQMHCEVGIGRNHAKWSPVCTANYRLLPTLIFQKDVVGADADELVRKCPTNVFDIEEAPDGVKKAIATDPRKCTTCRECITSFDAETSGLILGKKKDHYLFSIEATGHIPATQLFERAIRMLAEKCKIAKSVLEKRPEN